MKNKIVFILFLFFSFTHVKSQNLITVPFANGFVGDNGGSNSALNCYYHSGTGGLGFTNVQFAQNSTSNIFTAQGNDIIGMVLITDNSGVEHTINGFIKWRSPSGNSPYVMIFEPAAGSSATLATNGFNGSATYTITDTKYIGLVFNGNTLTISPVPGTVTGNAATNGLLDALNAYLATFGKLSVADVTVNEGAGTATATVTLSASSTNVITVAYTTSDGTATVGSDYTATSGTLTFAAGVTSRTFTIPINNDLLVESTETINVTLSDPINASILDGAGIVSILDNDSSTPESNAGLDGVICSGSTFTTSGVANNGTITWTTSGTGTFTNGTTISATYTPSAEDITAGSVTLTMTVSGTGSAADTMVLTITPLPSAGTLTGTQAICVGNTTTFDSTVSGGVWNSSDTAVAIVNISGVITGVATGTATITYTVTGTGGCADASATRNIAVNAIPNSPIVSQTTICGDVTNISSYVTLSAGHTINITSTINNTPTISNVNAPVGQTLGTGIYTIGQSFTPLSNYDLSAVSFYATAANASAILTVKLYSGNGSNGTLLATKSISNTVPGEIIFNLNNPVPLTQNQIYTYIVETNTNFSHTISWNSNGNPYPGGSYWRYGSNFSTSDIWFKIYKVGSYEISQINSTGCESNSVSITVTPSPSSGTISGSQAVCVGNSTTFTSTVNGGIWTSSDTTVATVNASGVITGVASGAATITYTVTGTGGCEDATATRNVAVTAIPNPPSGSVTVQPTCATTTGTIVFTTQSGVEYSIDGTNYQSSETFTGVATGTYTLRVRSSTDNSCIATGGNVTVNTIPSLSSIQLSDISVNENAGYAIFDVAGPANIYVSLFLNNQTALGLGVDYGAVASQLSLGQSNLEYSNNDGITWTIYQDYAQLSSCGQLKVRTPINDDNLTENNETFKLVVNPIAVDLGTISLYNANYNSIDLSGLSLESGSAEAVNAVYKKTNAITVNSQAIDVRIKIIAKSNIGTGSSDYVFDDDGSNIERFQSVINSTSASGSFIDYKIEFFKSGLNIPVALTNFYVTGVDIDGSSASSKEYIELSNFSSYTINDPTGLTIGISPTNTQNTRFTGINNSLSGITFENTASFIANYQSPLTELNFRKGVTGTSTARQFSVSFGILGGVFSNPIQVSNDISVTGIATIIDNDNCTLSTPSGSVTVQPTCATTTGIIVFTNQSGVEYSIDGTNYQSSATFTGVAAGTYTLKVRSTTDNTCTATGATVAVYDPICAIADTFGPINGLVGGTTASVLTNDTLNGVAVTASAITLTGVTVPTGLTLNPNGTITIAPNTPAGTLTLTYQICENLNPTNCDTATVTIIIGSCLEFPINDCDGDGVTNGQEILDGTNPSDSCSFQLTSQTVTPSSQWLTFDCDGDGVTNGQEVLDGTNSLDPCDFEVASITLTQSASWNNADCDGDGVTNGQEIIDGTDLNNPCEANMLNATLPLSQEFLEGDCDGDGLTNGEEIGSNPNEPFDPNANGIPDYLEVNNHTPSDDDIEIFNLVTPNGDGDNDVFVIRNIESYPENALEIYNRWGVKVYDVNGYGQDDKYFRGISEGRVTISQVSELPVGTYWYILKYKNVQGNWKERRGYLYLNK